MCQRSNLNNNLQWWWRYQQRLQFLSLNSFKEVFQTKIHDMHWKSIAAKKAVSVNANKFLCKMEREKGWMSFTFWCAFSPSTPKLSIILTIVKCAFLVCLRFQNAIESNSMLGMRPKRQHSKSVHCANTFFIFILKNTVMHCREDRKGLIKMHFQFFFSPLFCLFIIARW